MPMTIPIKVQSSSSRPAERCSSGSARIAFVTLGCPKNLVDSEHMIGLLGGAGFETTGDLDQAEVAVVNTCSFVDAAREESVAAILEVAAHKTSGRLRGLVVAGCLAQRYGAELVREIPEVDAVLGTGEGARISSVVEALLAGSAEPAVHVGAPGAPVVDYATRAVSTPRHHAYLKISEGCDHRCAFCIIPALRGPLKSRAVADVVAEAERLVAGGVRELNLVSQDTTGYGTDLAGGRRELLRLLAGLDRIPGVVWIRLLYTYPALWTTELMDAMASLEHVAPYVDVPIQHVSERMLRRMNRGISARRQRQFLAELRRRVPGVAVRTTVIVGHPGETEEDFAELRQFLRDYRFERLGVFAYSPEEGTPAGVAADPVPKRVAQARKRLVEADAAQIARELHAARVGTTIDVMVDGPKAGGLTPSRSTWDAPEIDGRVWIRGDQEPAGRLVRVEVTGAGPRDLVAVPVGEVTAFGGDR
jgi:ribosomal protein S12 methylthiotransferase